MQNVAYVKTPSGEELAVLPRAELEALVAAVEHNMALADYRAGKTSGLTPAEAIAFAEAASPLAFWRKKRGMTQTALAKAAGVAQGYISELENGNRGGDLGLWMRMAKALDLPLEAIVEDLD
jgi:DNA-binding XRE family transcriptional regulator